MHGKKAQISPVFKYIFSVVAGVIFLSFFIGFAMQHKDQQTKIETGRILYGFDDLLTLLSTSGDASMIYPEKQFPSIVELKFAGDKITSGTLTKTTSKIAFSENQLRGKQFYLWTKRWNMPFIVDNFFYLADGRVPIYLIYNDESKDMADELTEKYSGFPKTFNIDKIHESKLDASTLSSLRSRAANSKRMRFVSLNVGDLKTKIKPIQNADLLEIKPTEIGGEKSWGYGTAIFEGGSEVYLGKEMLAGAIVAENLERYRTSKEKAIEKLHLMAALYKNKAQILNTGSCQGNYNQIMQSLEALASAEPTPSELEEFAGTITNLKDLNRQFESGCQEVF